MAELLKRPDLSPQVEQNTEAIRTFLTTLSEPHGHADAETGMAHVAAEIVKQMN